MGSKIECPDCTWEFYSPYTDIRDRLLKAHCRRHHNPSNNLPTAWRPREVRS